MNELAKKEPTPIAQRSVAAELGQLLSTAKEQGLGPEGLEKLLDVYERVADRGAKQAFNDAKSAFQDECPAVPRTEVNSQFKRPDKKGVMHSAPFAPLDVMQRIAGPILTRHGFSTDWERDTAYEQKNPGQVCPVFVLSHRDGFEKRYPGPMPVPKPVTNRDGRAVQTECQCVGVALEYGRRQAYRDGTGIRLEGVDEDGNLPDADQIDETISEEDARSITDKLTSMNVTPQRKAALLKSFGVIGVSDLRQSQLDSIWNRIHATERAEAK